MHPFSTPWKRQKTLRFSDIFRGYRKDALATTGLKSYRLWSRVCNTFFYTTPPVAAYEKGVMV